MEKCGRFYERNADVFYERNVKFQETATTPSELMTVSFKRIVKFPGALTVERP